MFKPPYLSLFIDISFVTIKRFYKTTYYNLHKYFSTFFSKFFEIIYKSNR